MITQDELKRCLQYDPETGEFTWISTRTHQFQPGYIAGSNRKPGTYITIRIGGHRVNAHRLAWLYVHGYMPQYVDHIDGDVQNNRISNLRAATKAENCQNRRMSTRNKSGFIGVSWLKRDKVWVAFVRVNGKHHHLGSFRDRDAAIAARLAGAEKHYGEFAPHKRAPSLREAR